MDPSDEKKVEGLSEGENELLIIHLQDTVYQLKDELERRQKKVEEAIELPIFEWHRFAMNQSVCPVAICLRHTDGNGYYLPPRVGWDFTGEKDTTIATGKDVYAPR